MHNRWKHGKMYTKNECFQFDQVQCIWEHESNIKMGVSTIEKTWTCVQQENLFAKKYFKMNIKRRSKVDSKKKE
jgi:hypothetical protein